MSSSLPWVSVPIVHAMIVVGLLAAATFYAFSFSETMLGVPVLLLAVIVYVLYLGNRGVVAVERIAFDE